MDGRKEGTCCLLLLFVSSPPFTFSSLYKRGRSEISLATHSLILSSLISTQINTRIKQIGSWPNVEPAAGATKPPVFDLFLIKLLLLLLDKAFLSSSLKQNKWRRTQYTRCPRSSFCRFLLHCPFFVGLIWSLPTEGWSEFKMLERLLRFTRRWFKMLEKLLHLDR